MKLISGIALVLLVVITKYMLYEDRLWQATPISAMDGWNHSEQLATSAAAWSPASLTFADTLQSAAPKFSLSIFKDPQELELEERSRASVVVVEEGEEEGEDSIPQLVVPGPESVAVCSETSVIQELGPDFYPSSLVYVRCDERDFGCSPPSNCTPVSSVVTLTMLPWTTLVLYPHSCLDVQRLPNGHYSVSLLVVITSSGHSDDLQCETTQASAMDGWSHSAELATSAAAWAPAAVSSTETLQTTAPEASLRLADAVEEEAPDYYDDEAYEATSAGDQSSTAIEAARVQEYEPPDYYDDEPPVVSPGGHGAYPASVSEEGVSSIATQGSGTTSFGKSTAPSGGRATVSTREEAGGSAAPEPSNWISWLPSWCRHWPLIGPLGVPRDMQLQAYAEALAEQTVGITNYWLQTAEPSTAEPQTHFVSIVMRQVEMLLEFYKWMYQQLSITESSGNRVPESLDRFLRALQHHTTMVKSINRLSPSTRLTCNAPDAGILRKFFWAMDRLIIWVHVLHNWAANQYNLAAGPHRNANWCPPFSLNEGTLFNASHLSTWNLTTGDSVSDLEAVSSTSVCNAGERDVVVGNENSEDLPSGNYCSNRQLHQQAHKREVKWPSCVLQSISTSGHGNEQLTATDGMPVTDNKPEMLSEECGDELKADDSPPRYGLHSDAVEDIHPDDGIYEDQEVMDFEEWRSVIPVVEEGTAEEEVEEDSRPHQIVPDLGNLGVCSETSVKLELGPGFFPSSLQYVRCDERDLACSPPERCTPVSSLATLTLAPWATLPEFPHSYLGALQLPNGSVSVSLLRYLDTSLQTAFDDLLRSQRAPPTPPGPPPTLDSAALRRRQRPPTPTRAESDGRPVKCL